MHGLLSAALQPQACNLAAHSLRRRHPCTHARINHSPLQQRDQVLLLRAGRVSWTCCCCCCYRCVRFPTSGAGEGTSRAQCSCRKRACSYWCCCCCCATAGGVRGGRAICIAEECVLPQQCQQLWRHLHNHITSSSKHCGVVCATQCAQHCLWQIAPAHCAPNMPLHAGCHQRCSLGKPLQGVAAAETGTRSHRESV